MTQSLLAPDRQRCFAVFSPDRRYRYELYRCWAETPPEDVVPALHVIGLNPSTADEERDDPTVRRLIGFAKRHGFGQLLVTNLFAYRATSPADMRRQPDPVGPDNDRHIRRGLAWGDVTVVAWGTHGAFRNRHDEVCELLRTPAWERDIRCFGRTREGFPRHPLYLAADTPLEGYL